jgi:hypothetical protein
MTSNYFVEINPGEKLEGIINAKKAELIAFFGNELVNDSSKVGHLRDPPHFTLMGGRTGDLYTLTEKLKKIGDKFSRINYKIIGIEDNPVPGYLFEMRTVVAEKDRQKFKDLHLEVLESSLPFNTAGVYEKWEKGFEGEALENIKYCGFPVGRNLYKPHTSIGKVHKDLRGSIDHLMNESVFNPRGNFTTGNLIVWRLPFDKDDPTAVPIYHATIPLKEK